MMQQVQARSSGNPASVRDMSTVSVGGIKGGEWYDKRQEHPLSGDLVSLLALTIFENPYSYLGVRHQAPTVCRSLRRPVNPL